MLLAWLAACSFIWESATPRSAKHQVCDEWLNFTNKKQCQLNMSQTNKQANDTTLSHLPRLSQSLSLCELLDILQVETLSQFNAENLTETRQEAGDLRHAEFYGLGAFAALPLEALVAGCHWLAHHLEAEHRQ